MKDLKQYDPKEVEDRIYEMWLKGNYFHAEVNKNKKPFTIMMPPPNVTGQLHMGHALDNTLQDSIIRWKRMQGYEALWQPGCDHAAIATEVKVTNKLKEMGIDKASLGREGFLKEAWKWKEEYEGRIVNQLHRMGSSADWERLRFTMDEGCSEAVETVFIKLYKKGYIYKGSRLINWCPVCRTSLSDAEVLHEEQESFFWHILYPVEGSEKYIEVATTRPETMLGDSAVAVNPEDERYKDLIGKNVRLPLTDRLIPIIADEHADMEFGTGAVKITPAHDPNDFEVGHRHGLPEINILTDDARILCPGSKYDGLDRYEARKMMVEDLKEMGLLAGIEPTKHNVGTHDRCHTTVEPMIKPQWFVKMDEMAKPAIKAIETGELKFIPENYSKTYLHWLENIKDWCISRQLWWGHRIPAWYCDSCGKTYVGKTAPSVCPECNCKNFTQDPDTLDTWFSSALWPFETLGWPKETEEYKYFYPTDVLVTGYDIIFFWVVRMVFSGYEQTGHSPFKKVLIHGLVRDELGRKMSKSLGNGIDPLEIIDSYGADSLRMMLLTGNAPGNDMRFVRSKLEASRNFMNKLWNASRFIMMNMGDKDPGEDVVLTGADRWILSRVNNLCLEVTRNMEAFDLGIALDKVTGFIWDEFCDWYIEMVKPRLYDEKDETRDAALFTLKKVLIQSLKLIHPFCPFISEELFDTLSGEKTALIRQEWPVYEERYNFPQEEKEIETVKNAVRLIRNLRAEINAQPSKRVNSFLVSESSALRETFRKCEGFFLSLSKLSSLDISDNNQNVPENSLAVNIPGATIYLPFAELVDADKEIKRLEGEIIKLEGEIKRAKGMLSNEKFIKKAPEEKVNEEKEKLEKYSKLLNQTEERLRLFKK